MNKADGGQRVWVVYGTRPEAIKMAPIIDKLKRDAHQIQVTQVFSGQHRELAEDLFEFLSLAPDVELKVMREDQQLHELASRCLDSFTEHIVTESPDCILVQGDTATVFFASLSAYFGKTQIGHVEAGLRSHRKYAPFPEEMMRHLTDVLADFHFAPTGNAAENLRRENVAPESIYVTGNTVIDAVRGAAATSEGRVSPWVREWVDDHAQFVLITLHRRESFGEDMHRIMATIAEFASENPDIAFIYPVHPNPSLRDPVNAYLSDKDNIYLFGPVGYIELIYLLKHCTTVLTDSGGIQEEGPALGKKVLVARRVTERPEGIEAGVAELVGADPGAIKRALTHEVETRGSFRDDKEETPYGDGRAADRIVDIVKAELLGIDRRTTDWEASQ